MNKLKSFNFLIALSICFLILVASKHGSTAAQNNETKIYGTDLLKFRSSLIEDLPIEPDECSVCGRCLYVKNENNFYRLSGIIFKFSDGTDIKKLFPEIARKAYSICPVCMLKAYGVKLESTPSTVTGCQKKER